MQCTSFAKKVAARHCAGPAPSLGLARLNRCALCAAPSPWRGNARWQCCSTLKDATPRCPDLSHNKCVRGRRGLGRLCAFWPAHASAGVSPASGLLSCSPLCTDDLFPPPAAATQQPVKPHQGRSIVRTVADLVRRSNASMASPRSVFQDRSAPPRSRKGQLCTRTVGR